MQSFEEILHAMKSCEQMPGLSVLAHGEMVNDYFLDLIKGTGKFSWKLPDWCTQEFLEKIGDIHLISTYLVYHDAGKPFCRTVDSEGRQHFPNHAEVSYQVMKGHLSPEIRELIRRDMDMHLMKPSEIRSYDRPDLIPTLLLAALSEIHANATMFGGIESTSFKIKWKALNRLGNAYLKNL